jgi:hypothetical protein
MSLSVMHELFVDFTTSYDLKEKITDEDISELLEVAADFEKRWPIAYPQLNKIFTDIRLGKTQLDSEEEMNSKLDKFTEEIKGRGLTQKMIFSTRCNFQK